MSTEKKDEGVDYIFHKGRVNEPIIVDSAYHLPSTGGYELKCSKCGDNFVEPFDNRFKPYLFCPLCGTRTKE